MCSPTEGGFDSQTGSRQKRQKQKRSHLKGKEHYEKGVKTFLNCGNDGFKGGALSVREEKNLFHGVGEEGYTGRGRKEELKGNAKRNDQRATSGSPTYVSRSTEKGVPERSVD